MKTGEGLRVSWQELARTNSRTCMSAPTKPTWLNSGPGPDHFPPGFMSPDRVVLEI